MTLTRREMLAACAAVPALSALAAGDDKPQAGERPRMGVVIHSYGLHSTAARQRGDKVPFGDPLRFVEHCQKLGAGGVQVPIGNRDKEYVARLRALLESAKMYLEGSIRLPADKADVERFTAEVRIAKECGAAVLRSAILSGRRYETFDTAAAFRKFADGAYRSLGLAEPVVAKHDVRLAVENHKDWRASELLDLLKRLSSRHVGVCVDTGNSIALLEEPMEVVEAYSPWAFSTHIKDMGVAEYDEGFLLSEVPFGDGFLDLKRIVEVLRKARPEVRFNVEMITRDPLKVPCLTMKYWATFETLPGRHLAATLAMVRKHTSKQPLPQVSGLPAEKKLAVEQDNVRRCLAYARERLNL
jgi:sugar phosphate isomerase/epimerase